MNDRTAMLVRDDVQLRLVGIPVLDRSGLPALRLERKDAALLALLAIDGATPRARAAAQLWPDASPTVARANLRQRLFRLRAAAGRDLVIGDGTLLRLADDVTPDLGALHDLLRADPHAAQGELLAGHDYGAQEELALWVQAARAHFRARRLDALAQAASGCEAERQIARALVYAQRMVADDPLLEHAHRRLMRLHYLRGDRAAALAAYEACRTTLGEQLGMRPSVETVELARLVEAGGTLAQPALPPRPVGMLRPPRLVGRASEWQVVLRRLRAAGAAVIEGEAGIGKSRLLQELALDHASDRAVVCGARPGGARLSYALAGRLVQAAVERFEPPASGWARAALAHIAPLLGVAQAPAPPALRLQQALIEALHGWQAEGLALLVIDDLHFADEATLELLPALLAALREAGVPVLLATRPGGPALTGGDSALERVALGPLDSAGVQALLQSLALPGLDTAVWAPALLRHTGGNPLFILETLLAQLDQASGALPSSPLGLRAPAGIGALVERRLAPLSAGALKLARLAAVAGSDFSVDLAADVFGQHALDIADHWRELETAHVIRDAGFAHDLIHEATLRSVPVAIARHLHEAVARHLAARGGTAAHIAPHWQAAERWAEAGAAYEAAALEAQARSRRAEEATFYERAAECHECDGATRAAFRMRCVSVKAVLAARPLAEASSLTERLLADASDDNERLDAHLRRALLLALQQRGGDSHAQATMALDFARRLGLREREFDALRGQATALALQGHGSEGVKLLQPLQDEVQAQASPRAQLDYWSDLAYVLVAANRRRESADAWRRAADVAVKLGDRDEAVTCTGNLAVLSLYLGRPEQAREQALRAQRMQAELGHADDVVAGVAAMNIAASASLVGRFDDALAALDSAQACFRNGQAVALLVNAENSRASVWLQLGQTARAGQALDASPAGLPPVMLGRRLLMRARVQRALGRPSAPLLAEALAALGDPPDAVQHAMAQIDASRERPPHEAAVLCRQVAERAAAQELLAAAMRARLFEIEADLRAGHFEPAHEKARSVARELPDCRPMDTYWAEVLWLVYQAHAAVGEPAASGLLRDAARWVRETAASHVPEPFRDAFLHRHPVNRPLLALADRQAA
jgi:DNA-binding SARP family transcriptional activator/tetratricopeptide (TPR) repeat protein